MKLIELTRPIQHKELWKLTELIEFTKPMEFIRLIKAHRPNEFRQLTELIKIWFTLYHVPTCLDISVVVFADLWGRELHRQVGVGIVVIQGVYVV